MKEKKFSVILNEARRQLKLSHIAMAEKLGISERMYKDYEKGRFDETYSVRKEKYLDMVNELLRNNSSENQQKFEAIELYPPTHGKNIFYIPLYAYGGFLQGYSNQIFMETLEKFSLPGIHGEHYAFEVQGHSMTPFASPGDVVVARREEHLDYMVKDRVYVLQTIDGILIKFFDKIEYGKALFKSANIEGDNPVIPLKNLKVIYQVVRVLKDPYK